ncbi:MAG: SIMPL domain-containing protein [Patescibacteria group bacterium]|nr:SIMPL domain-containing protein [Patescibacteria group bacterium]
MNTKLRNYLGGAAILLSFAVVIGIFVFLNYYSQSVEINRTFSASGTGEAVGIPNVAQVTASVLTQGGKDIASLQSQNSQKANNIISFLQSQGVERKDIQTQSYNLEPRYTYYSCAASSASCPPPTITGYTITQAIQIKIRDFSKIGGILTGVVADGANTISQLSFTTDSSSTLALEDQARGEAITKAQERAQAIAKEAGFRLGRLIAVNVVYSGEQPPVPIYNLGAAPSAVTPNIQPGSEKITATATLTYEIN